jgi:hypothetical protein
VRVEQDVESEELEAVVSAGILRADTVHDRCDLRLGRNQRLDKHGRDVASHAPNVLARLIKILPERAQ